MNLAIKTHFGLNLQTLKKSEKSLNNILKTENLSHNNIIDLIQDLDIQLELLADKKKGLLFLSDKDIYYINNHYIIMNENEIYDIVDNQLQINKPFNKNEQFLAPEIKTISKLPAVVNKSTVYYSIGLLISGLIKTPLEEIKNSKLYFMIKRCLQPNPNNRFFIYI